MGQAPPCWQLPSSGTGLVSSGRPSVSSLELPHQQPAINQSTRLQYDTTIPLHCIARQLGVDNSPPRRGLRWALPLEPRETPPWVSPGSQVSQLVGRRGSLRQCGARCQVQCRPSALNSPPGWDRPSFSRAGSTRSPAQLTPSTSKSSRVLDTYIINPDPRAESRADRCPLAAAAAAAVHPSHGLAATARH